MRRRGFHFDVPNNPDSSRVHGLRHAVISSSVESVAQSEPKESAVLSPGMSDRLLSVEEVAELLQVPLSWVYDRTRSRGLNRIPGFRLGKYWRFDEGEVRAWLARQRSGGRVSA
jgi:excisionase family DNA binding protein